MLEGLEAVELKLSEVLKDNEEFRIDSEYFKKEFIILDKYFKNAPQLKDLVYMSDLSTNGSFKTVSDIIHDDFKKVIPFIRSGNVGETFINKNDLIFISKEAHEKLLKSATKLHDIVMARKGKIGGATIIMEEDVDFNCNENVIKLNINDKNKLNPFYFTSFFNSKYGLMQINRTSTGNVQPWVSIFQIRKLAIPILSNTFQFQIETLVRTAYDKLKESKTLYKEAEELLLEELDLKDYQPSDKSIAIKSFSQSFGATGRLDSEYYQPKYDEILEKIKSYKGGDCKLNELVIDYSTGYPYKSNSFVENGVYLIRINNLTKDGLNLENAVKIPYKDKNLSSKDIIKINDILISMSGTIGLSCKVNENIEAVLNQRILKISIKNYSYDVLSLLINSIIGKLQIERIGTGGVQTNISAKDILKLLIPLIQDSIQTQIEQKIKDSFKLKKESKELLDLAVKAVEIAIEKDENKAMEFLDE